MSEQHLTPRQIVAELDKYIVGQADAKRAVAVAIRNRWRRQQLPEPMRKMTLAEQKTYLDKVEAARRKLREEVLTLDRQRNEFLEKKEAEDARSGRSGFDRQVIEALGKQARRFGIDY